MPARSALALAKAGAGREDFSYPALRERGDIFRIDGRSRSATPRDSGATRPGTCVAISAFSERQEVPGASQSLRVASSISRLPARGRGGVLERLGSEVHRRHLRRLRDPLPRRVARLRRAPQRGGRARGPATGRLAGPKSFLQNAPILATLPRPRYALVARLSRESGETGRRSGLRIRWVEKPLGVRLPPLAPIGDSMTVVCVVRS
jgi:hypothetical protein